MPPGLGSRKRTGCVGDYGSFTSQCLARYPALTRYLLFLYWLRAYPIISFSSVSLFFGLGTDSIALLFFGGGCLSPPIALVT
ncbi:hypothetical protein DFH08DRAFT_901581, partial [Mycena albidolilacea]